MSVLSVRTPEASRPLCPRRSRASSARLNRCSRPVFGSGRPCATIASSRARASRSLCTAWSAPLLGSLEESNMDLRSPAPEGRDRRGDCGHCAPVNAWSCRAVAGADARMVPRLRRAWRHRLQPPHAYRLTGVVDAAACAAGLQAAPIATRSCGRPTRRSTTSARQIVPRGRAAGAPAVGPLHLAAGAARQQALTEALVTEARRPFHLETELPVRFTLITLGEREHAFWRSGTTSLTTAGPRAFRPAARGRSSQRAPERPAHAAAADAAMRGLRAVAARSPDPALPSSSATGKGTWRAWLRSISRPISRVLVSRGPPGGHVDLVPPSTLVDAVKARLPGPSARHSSWCCSPAFRCCYTG